MKYLNLLKAALIAVLFSATLQINAAETLDELLQEVRTAKARAEQIDQQRLATFRADRSSQAAKVRDLKAKLAAQEQRSANLKDSFENNEKELTELNESLDIQLGDLKELFGIVRQEAGDIKSIVSSSLVSAQYPGRDEFLTRMAAANELPDMASLDRLRQLMQEEMTEEARIVKFNANVADSAGNFYDTELVRVGVYNLISGDKYYSFDSSTGVIQELGRQPKPRFRDDAGGLFSASGGINRMSVDPTYGGLLKSLVQSPNTKERVDQGGPVGYVILALGAIGLIIGVIRLLYLAGVGAGVNRQLKSGTPSEKNALGRILKIHADNEDLDTETLELKLDEAILRETPKLEKWQGAIKIVAAVAPLLGLLGTVVGMIETFQNITLFGTGDPKLMADGISKALVTTMLGLIVAIPMVLLHSIVASRSKALVETLEQQSAGIIARQSENEL